MAFSRREMTPTHGQIQKAVVDYLRWNGWFVYPNRQSAISHKGISDLTAVRKGRVLWIEIKKPGDGQSKDQIKFQQDIEARGGQYLIAKRIEDVEVYIIEEVRNENRN